MSILNVEHLSHGFGDRATTAILIPYKNKARFLREWDSNP